MASKKLVVGNMKMNLTAQEVNKYLKAMEKVNTNGQVVICPSTLYLPYFVGKNFQVGIQNIAAYESGAYTGEVSAKQAKSIRMSYTIIGHSERRAYFHETDEIVHQKIGMALEQNLKVILCIGETEAERDALKTYPVLKKQIKAALKGLESKEVSKIVIAYEPVWAIGTGRVPSNQEIQDTITFIKDIVKEISQVDISVLYGGSVTDTNIAKLNKIENVDGYLVGGASTKADQFQKIIEVVVTQ